MDNLLQIEVLTLLCLVNCVLFTNGQVEGAVRLAGQNSNSSTGRVEVFHSGLWGTVCDDGFDVKNAIVVCHQLNFTDVASSQVISNTFGPGTGTIWMDDVRCRGTEARLVDCQFSNWNRSDCTHDEDVAVRCYNKGSVTNPNQPQPNPPIIDTGNCTTPDPNVRVRGPSNMPGLGVVQIFRNGAWGGVCDNDWDTNDARVVCRMLCYNPNNALAGSVNFDMSNITEPMVINSVNCNGNEANLNACETTAGTCQQTEMARVTCIQMTNRPVPLLECTGGNLTARFSRLRDPNLEMKHLQVAYPLEPCNVVKGNESNYVLIAIPFDQCGTERTENSTHIKYKNTIRYLPTSTSSVITNSYIVEVFCELPRNVIADKPIHPITAMVTQTAPGEFVVAMNFFRDNGFQNIVTNYPLEVPIGEYLSSVVSMGIVDKTLRLVVTNCFATPSADRNNPTRYPLFTNKCVDDPTVSFYNLNDTAFGFTYMTFKFVAFTEVYIHCDTTVCGKEETDPACDRSCFPPTKRRRRSVIEERKVYHVSSGTMIIYDPSAGAEIVRPHLTHAPPTWKPPTTSHPASGPTNASAPVITRTPATTKDSTMSPIIGQDHVTSQAPAHELTPQAQNLTSQVPAEHVSSQTPADRVTSQAPADHVTSPAPADHVTSPAPADHVTSQAPADHVTSPAPADHVTSQAPAGHVTSQAPAGQVTSQAPAGHMTTASANEEINEGSEIVSNFPIIGEEVSGINCASIHTLHAAIIIIAIIYKYLLA